MKTVFPVLKYCSTESFTLCYERKTVLNCCFALPEFSLLSQMENSPLLISFVVIAHHMWDSDVFFNKVIFFSHIFRVTYAYFPHYQFQVSVRKAYLSLFPLHNPASSPYSGLAITSSVFARGSFVSLSRKPGRV